MYIRQTAKQGKSQYVHRDIVETVLGRKLNRNEVVHHIDGNPTNNLKTNLLVCTQQYHMELHARERLQKLGCDFRTHSYCNACNTIHPREEFYKSKKTALGLQHKCKKASHIYMHGKGYSQFTWKERMNQQYRRANQKGLVSSLTKEGRRL